MADAPPQAPRQPKLRASCDECGAAKLKCDRGRPDCGRCISLGLMCIYSMSRKMGKPPRRRLQVGEIPGVSRPSSAKQPTSSIDKDTENVGIADGYIDSLLPSIEEDALDGLGGFNDDLFNNLLPRFTPFAFGDGFDWSIDLGLISSLNASPVEGYPTPVTQMDTGISQSFEDGHLDSGLLPPTDSPYHDCFREAYDILGSLSFQGSVNAPNSTTPLPTSTTTSASTLGRNPQSVPLDQMLRLNREASQRLGRLFECVCATCPHHALLYASIISRMLIRYQEAVAETPEAASNNMPLPRPSSSSISGDMLSMWPHTANSTIGAGGAMVACNSTSTSQTECMAGGPDRMTIGTFDVDDMRVQTALKIQLLSGEMGRVSRLIHQFTSHRSGRDSDKDDYSLRGGNGLYETLDSWLRGEHSSIANTLRSKLRELNN